ncbi:MAG: hypothetical protein WA414_03730 [Acidobacteriaceae bacterium]|jgi:hypothetical protein
MVTPIDAITTGMGFDEAGRWHDARTFRFRPAPRQDDDLMAPARGAIYGILGGGILWFGLILVGRFLIGLF